jgi:alkylation response protein AidB-like acyl-CoA dehydrogenase
LNTNKEIVSSWIIPASPLCWLTSFRNQLDPGDWNYIAERFYPAMTELYGGQRLSGADLLYVKKQLAIRGFGAADVAPYRGGAGRPLVVQRMIQFICGYIDLDLRDVAHVAHARMILEHGTAKAHERWDRFICEGGLAAICASEERGGTNLKAFETEAVPAGDGRWLLTGEKCHVSRIAEAQMLVIFFRTPDQEGLSAAVLAAGSPGIRREEFRPAGLNGWSWGRITFDGVPFTDTDFLGKKGDGIPIFNEHFEYYRPMVATLALGAAARVYDEAVGDLRRRLKDELIRRVMDSTLELLATARHEIDSELNYAVLANFGRNPEERAARSLSIKVCAVDRALSVSERLERILGARGFRETSAVAKALGDLRAYRYADGAHDALLRAAGKALLEL